MSFITGPEQDDNEDDYRTVFNSDLTLELIPHLSIGAEVNSGWEDNAAVVGQTVKWLAC